MVRFRRISSSLRGPYWFDLRHLRLYDECTGVRPASDDGFSHPWKKWHSALEEYYTQMKLKGKKVFYGWWIAAAGSALYGLGSGSVFYGFNVSFNPMISEFGWSRAVTSGAFSMSRLEGGPSRQPGWLTHPSSVDELELWNGILSEGRSVKNKPFTKTSKVDLYIHKEIMTSE